MSFRHIVAAGETTSGLAHDYGFSPYAIWDYPDNADLRKTRRHMNILMPGDVIIIPDKKLKEIDAATEQVHHFVLQNTPALFQLQLYYSDGKPRQFQDYKLYVDDKSYAGTTDEQGALIEYISPKAKTGKIVFVPEMETISLRFGMLNPIAEDSGVRQRLTNLGFAPGESADELKAALTAFQKQCNLAETGEMNEETRRRLEDLHDTVSDYPISEDEKSGTDDSV